MSIKSAIKRSADDNDDFKSKSYAEVKGFKVERLDLDKLSEKQDLSDCERRILANEYNVQGCKVVYRIFSSTGITLNQIREIFDDMGFNVDVDLSWVHYADITAVTNIGGFVMPFWRSIVALIIRYIPEYELMLLSKLSPGKKRVHLLIFHENDNSWYVTTHVDELNWWVIFRPFKMLKAHLSNGQGNYKLGDRIMRRVFDKLILNFKKEKLLVMDIDKIYKEESSKSKDEDVFKKNGAVMLTPKIAQFATYFLLASRILVPFLIFVNPFWIGILLMALDGFDYVCIMNSKLFNKKEYQMIDKILDIYYLTFMWFVSLNWGVTILIWLYLFRLVGFLGYLITGKRVVFAAFPNLFEPMFNVYSWGFVYSSAFLGFLSQNMIYVFGVVFVVKMVQEFYLHYFTGDSLFYQLNLVKKNHE